MPIYDYDLIGYSKRVAAHAREGEDGRMWEWFLQAQPPAQTAVVAGIVSLVVGFITAAATIGVAKQRAAIDQKLAALRGEIDRGIAERRAALDLRLQELRTSFDREAISAEPGKRRESHS